MQRLSRINAASILDGPSYEQKTRQWEQTLGAATLQEFVCMAQHDPQQVVGFASGRPALLKASSLYRGELFTLYFIDAYQLQGLGQRLFFHVVQH